MLATIKLFFAWSAFVFIPFNLIVGTIIRDASSTLTALFGIIVGTLVLIFLTIPAVYYASKSGRNFSTAVEYEIQTFWLKTLLKIIVPIVNTCWFILQTAFIVEILTGNALPFWSSAILYFAASALFVSGSYWFGYRWLYIFGAVGFISLLLFVFQVLLNGQPSMMPSNSNEGTGLGLLNITMMTVGTWIFSSTTIVMDVAKEVKRPINAIMAVIIGTLLANVVLVMAGFLYANTEGLRYFSNPHTGLSPLFILLFISIWSTNDSNFYSTTKALNGLGISREWALIFTMFVVVIFGVIFGSDLYGIIGYWLQILGWFGIPMGLFWAFKIGHQRKQVDGKPRGG